MSKRRLEGSAIERLCQFRERVRWGPSYPCISCHQTLFRNQVFVYDTQLEVQLKSKCSDKVFKRTLASPPENMSSKIEEHRSYDYVHRMRYKKSHPGKPVPDQITFMSRQCNNIPPSSSLQAVCHIINQNVM